MRRWLIPVVVAGLLGAGTVPARAAAGTTDALHVDQRLAAGQKLTSAHGRYVALVDGAGRLVVRSAGGTVRWRSPAAGAGAAASVGPGGRLALRVGAAARWTTRTGGSGGSDVLRIRDDGVLELTAGGLTVWSTALPYACPDTGARVWLIDISRQWARACYHHQQLRATFVTTGASALGYGTPTGTWRVNANKRRNVTLYPAAGGAYPVKYWLPYDGNLYGLHDSSWQKFAYGSAKYRTQGSHGCTHVPLPMMRWVYHWAPIGTSITIRK